MRCDLVVVRSLDTDRTMLCTAKRYSSLKRGTLVQIKSRNKILGEVLASTSYNSEYDSDNAMLDVCMALAKVNDVCDIKPICGVFNEMPVKYE